MLIPDSEFVDGLEDLIDKGIIRISPTESSLSEQLFLNGLKQQQSGGQIMIFLMMIL